MVEVDVIKFYPCCYCMRQIPRKYFLLEHRVQAIFNIFN